MGVNILVFLHPKSWLSPGIVVEFMMLDLRVSMMSLPRQGSSDCHQGFFGVEQVGFLNISFECGSVVFVPGYVLEFRVSHALRKFVKWTMRVKRVLVGSIFFLLSKVPGRS